MSKPKLPDLTPYQALLLAHLSRQACNGLELRTLVKPYVTKTTLPAFYQALHRLADQGLVKSIHEASSKKRYITRLGLLRLREYIEFNLSLCDFAQLMHSDQHPILTQYETDAPHKQRHK